MYEKGSDILLFARNNNFNLPQINICENMQYFLKLVIISYCLEEFFLVRVCVCVCRRIIGRAQGADLIKEFHTSELAKVNNCKSILITSNFFIRL